MTALGCLINYFREILFGCWRMQLAYQWYCGEIYHGYEKFFIDFI